MFLTFLTAFAEKPKKKMFNLTQIIMSKNEMLIDRIKTFPHQTQCLLLLVDEKCKMLYHGVALELPPNGNARSISRIPAGKYKCRKIKSAKHGNCIHILNVVGRSDVLIHVGNYSYQSRGCVLVGSSFQDINADGLMDVVGSRKALNDILELLPNHFQLTIKN